MNERSVVMGSEHDYDIYEGFDAYPILSMPLFIVDYEYEFIVRPRKKEMVYL